MNSVYHPSMTCTQAAEQAAAHAATLPRHRKAEIQQSERFLQARCKNCPMCQSISEKVSGCDHITCPRCRYQYCWLCLADYPQIRRGGNEMHETNCPYHPNHLPQVPRETQAQPGLRQPAWWQWWQRAQAPEEPEPQPRQGVATA